MQQQIEAQSVRDLDRPEPARVQPGGSIKHEVLVQTQHFPSLLRQARSLLSGRATQLLLSRLNVSTVIASALGPATTARKTARLANRLVIGTPVCLAGTGVQADDEARGPKMPRPVPARMTGACSNSRPSKTSRSGEAAGVASGYMPAARG